MKNHWFKAVRWVTKPVIPSDRFAVGPSIADDPDYPAATKDTETHWPLYVSIAQGACDESKFTRLTQDQLSVVATLILVAWIRGKKRAEGAANDE